MFLAALRAGTTLCLVRIIELLRSSSYVNGMCCSHFGCDDYSSESPPSPARLSFARIRLPAMDGHHFLTLLPDHPPLKFTLGRAYVCLHLNSRLARGELI